MLNDYNPLFKTNAYQRTNKEAVDRDIFTEALEKASMHETNSIDNHFIIGSRFHAKMAVKKLSVINPVERLMHWLLNEVKSQEIRSLYVTILTGVRGNLITKEMHEDIYDEKASMMKKSYYYTKVLIKEPNPLHMSVNDDFELSIKLLRHGRRQQQIAHGTVLFLHSMLNPYELKLMEEKDETFLQSFARHHLTDQVPNARADVREEELRRFPDSDPRLRYVNCFCKELSLYLKS